MPPLAGALLGCRDLALGDRDLGDWVRRSRALDERRHPRRIRKRIVAEKINRQATPRLEQAHCGRCPRKRQAIENRAPSRGASRVGVSQRASPETAGVVDTCPSPSSEDSFVTKLLAFGISLVAALSVADPTFAQANQQQYNNGVVYFFANTFVPTSATTYTRSFGSATSIGNRSGGAPHSVRPPVSIACSRTERLPYPGCLAKRGSLHGAAFCPQVVRSQDEGFARTKNPLHERRSSQ